MNSVRVSLSSCPMRQCGPSVYTAQQRSSTPAAQMQMPTRMLMIFAGSGDGPKTIQTEYAIRTIPSRKSTDAYRFRGGNRPATGQKP